MESDPEDADTPAGVLYHSQNVGLGVVEQAAVKKSLARIASAWERKNCDQVDPVRRRAGSMPLALRISHTVDAATLTPKAGQLAMDPAVPLFGIFPGQSADQCPDVPASRRPVGLATHGPGGPTAADDVALPAQDRVRGDQEPQPVAPRFRYHAEQGREQRPVRQFRFGRRGCRRCSMASWWRRIRISAFFHVSSHRDSQPRGSPRDQEEDEPQAHDR